jgi:HlyD family secretion protein/epimerase transport system membrane fusion protein
MSSGKGKTQRLLAGKEAERRALPVLSASLAETVRRPVQFGAFIIVVFVAGAMGWASLAPIAAGAVAPGVISPDGNRRTVQHLEGGIIRAILARDGDEVKAGQVLLVLQDTQAAALHDVLSEQANTLLAMHARLVAEQADDDAVLFPPGLLTLGETDPRVRAVVSGQAALFEKRRATLLSQIELLDDRERQYEAQIVALSAQVASTEVQIELIAEEIEAKSQLFRQGLLPKSEMLRLQRAAAALHGEHGRLTASIAEVRQRIGETATQRISVTAERAEEVSTELEKVRTEFATVSERLAASRDVLDRTIIAAPVAGKVVNSHFTTRNGVIRPGEPILDIVPTGERLLIDARVSPSDIDVVRPGLAAVVHLTAYSNRGLPRIHGSVLDVSADRIVDPDTGQIYFLARVEVFGQELAELGKQYALLPGMPAEVMIVTGERTTMAYLLEPFMAAFRRGMRET